jgi:integrase
VDVPQQPQAIVEDPFALATIATRADQPGLPADIERYVEAARVAELARKGAGAPATLRAYRADWGVFTRWCCERARQPLPADSLTVAQYIRYLIDRPSRTVLETYQRPDGSTVTRPRREAPATTATVKRHVVSIRKAHTLLGLADPTLDTDFKNVWKGIRIERGVKPRYRKTEVDKHRLLHAVRAIGDEHRRNAAAHIVRKLTGPARERELQRLDAGEAVDLGVARAAQLQHVRDHAVLLLGWSGALRRGEVAAIDFADLHEEPQGLHIDLPRSKTNQEGDEEYVLIHRGSNPDFCAVRAVEEWRAALVLVGIVEGRFFRRIDRHGNILGGMQGAVVNRIVKRSAAAAGLDPDMFGAHSLRSGWISTGTAEGRREEAMMRHSRHLSISVFRGYVRRANKWDQHPGLGLL